MAGIEMTRTVVLEVYTGSSINRTVDGPWIYQARQTLDAICHRSGVRPVSSFLDYAEMLYQDRVDGDDDEHDDDSEDEGEEDEDEVGNAVDAMQQRMWDDMDWFTPAAGLSTLRALAAEVGASDAVDGLNGPAAREELLAGLKACIRALEKTRAGERFHFEVDRVSRYENENEDNDA